MPASTPEATLGCSLKLRSDCCVEPATIDDVVAEAWASGPQVCVAHRRRADQLDRAPIMYIRSSRNPRWSGTRSNRRSRPFPDHGPDSVRQVGGTQTPAV